MKDVVRNRAIDLTKAKFGLLNDLPGGVAKVVWVTMMRATETAIAAEEAGGAQGLLKNSLVGDGQLLPNLRESVIRVEFLSKMVRLIRDQEDSKLRQADSQILIDCLKWNIINAGEVSVAKRALRRALARADSLYHSDIPVELLS